MDRLSTDCGQAAAEVLSLDRPAARSLLPGKRDWDRSVVLLGSGACPVSPQVEAV